MSEFFSPQNGIFPSSKLIVNCFDSIKNCFRYAIPCTMYNVLSLHQISRKKSKQQINVRYCRTDRVTKFYLPYCVVRIISKFRMGSLVGRTSNSSITTELTFLLESADSALTALIIFP